MSDKPLREKEAHFHEDVYTTEQVMEKLNSIEKVRDFSVGFNLMGTTAVKMEPFWEKMFDLYQGNPFPIQIEPSNLYYLGGAFSVYPAFFEFARKGLVKPVFHLPFCFSIWIS